MGKVKSVMSELREFIEYYQRMKRSRPRVLYLYSDQFAQYQREVSRQYKDPDARTLTSFQGIPILEVHNDGSAASEK